MAIWTILEAGFILLFHMMCIGMSYLNDVIGKFVKYFSFPEQDFGYQVYGRSEKDVFVPIGSGISHYNGTDVQPLIEFSNSSVSIVGGDPAIFDNDVFFGLMTD